MGNSTILKAGVSALAAIVAMTGLASAQIETTNIDSSAFALGTLTPRTGAMSRTLWDGTDKDMVATLLTSVPTGYGDLLFLELLRRVTLSPGEGPAGADNALAGAKFFVAAEAGFYQDAASLASIVPGLRSEPALAKVVAYAELFDGNVDQACARGAGLRDGRTDPFWIKLRFVCYIRANEPSAAELTLDLLRRQGVLSTTEETAFTEMVAGQSGFNGDMPYDPLSYALMRSAGEILENVDRLSAASPGVMAAIARDARHPEPVREAALIKSIDLKTIGLREARNLVESMPTSVLASDLLIVAMQPKGTLEQADAIGLVLARNRGSWEQFSARAQLLAQELPLTEPIVNFAPAAEEVAIAAMINGQDAVVEKWILALAGDVSNPEASVRAARLIDLYAILDPGPARRLGSYVNYAFTPASIETHVASGSGDGVDLARFVSVGLNVAEAGSEGPAALLFLTGLNVPTDEASLPIRDTVLAWARDHADLNWLDREAIFRRESSVLLKGELSGDAKPTTARYPAPRVKPSVN